MTSSRPHPVRIAAFLAAVLMVLFIPPLVADDAAADPVEISSGHLDWGIKESWRNYIGAAGITVLGTADQNPDGTFRFPVTGGGYDATTKETTVQFGGGVEFLGHCTGAGGTHVRPCALDMTLVNPRIEITEDHAGLFVDSESRPIEGGEIVVDEDVMLAEIDVENAEPLVNGGVTTWSALANTLTLDGSRIFTYPLGTALDPLTFTYDGPGGKPVGEIWDAAGVTALTATDTATQPSRIASRVVGRLSTGELVGWHNSGSIAVLDPNTLEPKSQWLAGVSSSGTSLFRDSIAIDPATDTIFAAERTTNVGDRKLVSYRWNGTDLTATQVAGSYDATLSYDSGSGGAWDAANNRYVVARATSVAEHFIWQVKQVDGIWTASKVGRVKQVAAGSLFANALVNLEAIPNGRGGTTLIGTTLFGAGHVVRLTPVGGEYRPERFTEAGNVNADRLFASANGLYAVSSQDGKAVYVPYVGYADERRLGEASAPVAFSPFLDPNLNQGQVSFDPATDALVGLTDSNTLITRIERGELVYRAAVDGGPYPGGMVGVSSTGAIWGEANGKLQALTVDGVSPRITAQPEAPVARLLGESAEIELSAEATGSPTPELTWQTRIPGSGGWQDIEEGADQGRLATTVGQADRGRQFRVIAGNEHGRVVSDRVTLELRTPPSITVQPTDVSVGPGGNVELKVMPVGNPEPTVQWQQRLNGVWHDIPGATDPTLTFGNVELNLSGAAFRARLDNELGSVTSNRVTVTVVPPSTEPVSFNGGTVDWGISNRWRCYVTGQIARGSVELGAGVSKIGGTTPTGPLCVGSNPATNQPWGVGGEAYRFVVAGGSYEPATKSLEVDLKGTVRFIGHSYHAPDGIPLLDTKLSDLKIRANLETGQGFVLTDAAGATMENPEPFDYDDIKLAGFDASGLDLEPRNGQVKLEGLATVLQEQGAGVITYPAGEQFDPLDMTLNVGPRDPEPEPEAGKPVITRAKVNRIGARTVVARVSCPADSTSACVVRGPAKVRLAGGGKLSRKQRRAVQQRFVVRPPKTVAPGRVGAVRIVARPAQRRALRGLLLRGSLKVSAKSTGSSWTTKVVTIRGRVR